MTLVTYGSLFFEVMEASKKLQELGTDVTVIRLTEVSGFDTDRIFENISETAPILVIEEAAAGCGVHEALSWAIHEKNPNLKIYGIDLGCAFATHGKVDQLYKHYGLDSDSIVKKAKEVLQSES